ncbi:MAG: hypothetical protein CBC32_010360 [Proteobacteria bacterium TMED72]|nr:MAG: hypothetical protein CBC32_010360 [Proteobacteria bacterium TMED72]
MTKRSHHSFQNPDEFQLCVERNSIQGVGIVHGVLALTVLALWLIGPSLAAAGGLPSLLKYDWIEVESPNFSTMSMLSEAKTIELVRELELFRQLVFRFTTADSDASSIPNRIFLLKSRSNLRKLGIDNRDIVGLFVPGLRSNLILTAGGSKHNQHVIQHEYVHFLASRARQGHLPVWYSEGFAEFMASSRVSGDRISYGDVPAMRINSIERGQWVPFRKLIDRSEAAQLNGPDTSMLYAQSWLLVHYLHLGRSGKDLKAEKEEYLSHLKAGMSDTAAFEEAFGLETDSLRKTLRTYISSRKLGAYSIPLDSLDSNIDIKIEKVDKAVIAVSLARTMMALGNDGLEEPYIEYALANAPDSASALAAGGVSLSRQGRFREALPLLKKALTVAPTDPNVVIDMARFCLDRAKSNEASPEEREKWVKKAQYYFVRAWKLDDTRPEVYALYGQTFSDYGNRPEKAVEMLQEAASLLPSNLEIKYHLAVAHRRAGNALQALSLARSIAGSGHAGPTYGPKSVELMKELTEQCTPLLYSAFASELHLKTYLPFVALAKEPSVGTAQVSVTFEKNGQAKDIKIKRSSSDVFGDMTIEAIRAWTPFDTKSSMGFQCFSGKAYTFEFEVDETAFCASEERDRYENGIYKSILKTLHTDEMLSEPGSGRVQLTFWLNEEGGIRKRSVGRSEGKPVGAKLERAIDSLGPFGPPPGAASCWSIPLWQSFEVLGPDASSNL